MTFLGFRFSRALIETFDILKLRFPPSFSSVFPASGCLLLIVLARFMLGAYVTSMKKWYSLRRHSWKRETLPAKLNMSFH